MHELTENDKEKRLHYCRYFTYFIRGDVNILDKVFYIGEARFHLSGYVNTQNSSVPNAQNFITSTKYLGYNKHEEKSECMHRWTQWTFPALPILFSVFWFQGNLCSEK
jgi:hypothetical protein